MAKIAQVDAHALKTRLEVLFRYDAATGMLINRVARGRIPAGVEAGSLNRSNGYRYVHVDMVPYRAHRLVWLLHTGEWPNFSLDHINGNRDDNRVENLRKATRSQNAMNSRCYNRTGLKGVSQRKNGKWRAAIMANGKSRWLGYFDTAEDAHEAYKAAALELHGSFAHPTITGGENER